MVPDAAVTRLDARSYTIPTDAPEADGTLEWNRTSLVVVEVAAGGKTGLGYTYASSAAARVVADVLAPVVAGTDAMDVAAAWAAMRRTVRNLGRDGVCAAAISAVDVALWDLKAKLLDLPLARLLGMRRDGVAVYGSGGFTSYDAARLEAQLGGWASDGLRDVKMKVGARPGLRPLLAVVVGLGGVLLQVVVLHYRGAFNNALTYLPFTAPLLAVVLGATAVVAPGPGLLLATGILFWLTALVGFVGLGMHLRGLDRQHGGLFLPLFNWLSGPPAMAPSLFVALAFLGLAAIHLVPGGPP